MAAGSKIKNGGKTALLGGIGGLLGAGLKMLAEPALFKTSAAISKWFWVTPALEFVGGAVGGAFDKTALAGAGLAGAGVAHLVENANLAISIKRNAAAAGTPASTAGFDAGALVMPGELRSGDAGWLGSAPRFNSNVGSFDETGALVMPGQR